MKLTFMMWSQALLALLFLSVVTATAKAKAGPKAKGDPEPWDWQKNYPVFSPYSKPSHELPDFPEFLPTAKNISVMVGETASIPCRIKNLFEHHTVSWVRARDVTVLSVGHLIFSSDDRYKVVEVPRPILSASDWSLTITNVSKADEGMYELQINTVPKMNRKFHLLVEDGSAQRDSPYYEIMVVDEAPDVNSYETTHSKLKPHLDLSHDEGFPMWLHDNGCICPKPQFAQHSSSHGKGADMMIPGGPVQYVTEGDGVGLDCQVKGLSKPPRVLHWENRGKIVSAKERPGLSLEIERLDGISRASLYLAQAELEDTGNYTCKSDNEVSQSVLLVVTQGYDESPVEHEDMSNIRSSFFKSSSNSIFFSPSLLLLLLLALRS